MPRRRGWKKSSGKHSAELKKVYDAEFVRLATSPELADTPYEELRRKALEPGRELLAEVRRANLAKGREVLRQKREAENKRRREEAAKRFEAKKGSRIRPTKSES